MRAISRYRDNLLHFGAQHLQHMQAALDQMNLRLHHVIADLSGLTGMAIIEAILAGERDPRQLAKLRDPRIKASQETIAKALEGNWRVEHLFVLGQALQSWKQVQQQLGRCHRSWSVSPRRPRAPQDRRHDRPSARLRRVAARRTR